MVYEQTFAAQFGSAPESIQPLLERAAMAREQYRRARQTDDVLPLPAPMPRPRRMRPKTRLECARTAIKSMRRQVDDDRRAMEYELALHYLDDRVPTMSREQLSDLSAAAERFGRR